MKTRSVLRIRITSPKHSPTPRHICTSTLTGLATWDIPTGGMFLWMKFTDLEDSYQLIMDRLVERKVLFVAGKACNVSENQPCPYARISFSLASAEDMEKVRESRCY